MQLQKKQQKQIIELLEFVIIANDLVCYLKNNLGQIFKNEFDHKFPTVWSTLGYFNQKDFDIMQKFADTFDQFNKYYYFQSFGGNN